MSDEQPQGGERASLLRNAINGISRPYLLGLLLFSLYLAFLVLRPFLHTIIFAVVLASLFRPLHNRIQERVRRPNIAAGLSVTAITFCILIPLILFASALAAQGVQVTEQIREWFAQGGLEQLRTHPYLTSVWDFVQQRLPMLDLQGIDLRGNILDITRKSSEFLLSNSASILGNVAGFIVNFGIMLFILFYVLRDGRDMLVNIKHLSPLREEQENRILNNLRDVTYSVFAGSLFTALLQGLVSGVGMAIVGIPALFWGTMLAFSSLVPVVGTALIWIPCTVYLVLMGSYNSAIFFGLWCAVLVGSIDNFVRPFLMKGRGNLSTFFIFMAILGGVNIFGVSGLLYGPLVFGFAWIMLRLYQDEYVDELSERLHAVECEVSEPAEQAAEDKARVEKVEGDPGGEKIGE